MPESFAASGRVRIQQPYPTVTGSGTVQVDGGDNGAATGDVTISRSRFFSFGSGIGPGVYKNPMRANGVRVAIGGIDFSDFLDGPVEIKSTLDNYIVTTTARFSLRNPQLAYWSPQSISTEEKSLAIDFQSGPPGYVQTWRALTGKVQPTPNDEPWMPAAQFSGRSWLADILGQQVCVNLHAYSGICRRDILVQLAQSAGYNLIISGPPGATPKKEVVLNGVTFQQVLSRYCEIEGWIALDSTTPGLLTLIPESTWLSSVVSPSSAYFNFGPDDGMSYLEFKESPPTAPVTSWTISGTVPGPGQTQWGTGQAQNINPAQDGTVISDVWTFLGNHFERTIIATTRVFGTLTDRNTTVQKFNFVSTTEPFWWSPQSGVNAQPTTMYYQSVQVEGTIPGGSFGTVSLLTEDYTYNGCLISKLTRNVYGFDSLGVYGLRRLDVSTYNVSLETVASGYSIITASNLYDEYNSEAVPLPGIPPFMGNEATQETYIATDGNGNWTHTTAVQKYYPADASPFPTTEVNVEKGSGGIPLPVLGSDEKPVKEEQPFLSTATVSAFDFPIVEKNEFISDLENEDEATAVAMRRLRWEFAVAYTMQGRILTNEHIGDPEAITNHIRNMNQIGCFVAALTQTITPAVAGQSGDNLCERGLVAMLPWMVPPFSAQNSQAPRITLSARQVGGDVLLTWTTDLFNVALTPIWIYRTSSDGAPFAIIATDTSGYTDTNVTAGIVYTYYVAPQEQWDIFGQLVTVQSNLQYVAVA